MSLDNIDLQAILGNNTTQDIFIAMGIFVALVVAFNLLQIIILWKIRQLVRSTENDIDDTALAVFESIKPPIYITLALFISIKTLALSEFVSNLTNSAIVILIIYQIVSAIQILINYVLRKYLLGSGDESSKSAFKILTNFSKAILWFIGILVILQNIGINVTSLVAGMGIGGVAIAIASKEILSDLFSSFTIIFDKPFEEGDFIIVGDKMGTVKKIGIKTSRIQALQGEEIVFSNQTLTSEVIQNFKKMVERRIEFQMGVSYETSQTQLENIPDIIKEIIKKVDKTRHDRTNFKTYGDSNLIYETVYFIETDDYNEYMNIQEEINLKIFDKFAKEKIEFAYPTRTVILQK